MGKLLHTSSCPARSIEGFPELPCARSRRAKRVIVADNTVLHSYKAIYKKTVVESRLPGLPAYSIDQRQVIHHLLRVPPLPEPEISCHWLQAESIIRPANIVIVRCH